MANAQLLPPTQVFDAELASSSTMDEGRDMLQEVVMGSIGNLAEDGVSNEEIIDLLNEADAVNVEPPPTKLQKLNENEGRATFTVEEADRTQNYEAPSQPKHAEAEDNILYLERFSTPAYTVNSEGGTILGSLGIIFLGNCYLDQQGMAFDKNKVMKMIFYGFDSKYCCVTGFKTAKRKDVGGCSISVGIIANSI